MTETVSAATTTSGPPPAAVSTSVELPEVRWSWRRWVTVGVLLFSFAGVGWIIFKLSDAAALKAIALGLLVIAAMAHALYLIGPTATDVAKILGAVRLQIGALRVGADPSPPRSDA